MTNTNLPKLTKVCSSCGNEKPLSSYLQLSGDQAGRYGNVCATCRKAGKDKPKVTDDGSSRSDTGHRIDSKAKMAGDIERKDEHDRTEEEYFEEREENELSESELDEKKDHVEHEQRKHRDSFLGRSSFLTERKKSETKSGKSHSAVVQEGKERHNVSERVKEEKLKTDFDFIGPVQDTQIAGKIKHTGIGVRTFAAWVGRGSAIGKTLGSKQQPKQDNQQGADATLAEQAEKTFGPGRKR